MTGRQCVIVVGGRPDGHGRVVVETALRRRDLEVLGFLDDAPAVRTLCDVPWLGEVDAWRDRVADAGFHIAIGHNPTRRRLADAIAQAGGRLVAIVDPTAQVAASAQIGDGSFVAAGAVLAPGASVGSNCIVNHGAIVEHDVLLEDHVNVSSGFVSGGRARLRQGVFAGVGVVVIPDVDVARWDYLGAGAVVVEATEPHGLYVGVPARRVRDLVGTDAAPVTP